MKRVSAQLVAILLVAGCATHAPPSGAQGRTEAETAATAFLDALRVRDEAGLKRLTGLSWGKGDLDPGDEEHVFGEGVFPSGARSLQQIARTPDLVAVVTPTDDPRQVFAYFIRPRDVPKMRDHSWLERRFQQDFFLCRIEHRGEFWVPLDDYCYAEQDNPFSPPYG